MFSVRVNPSEDSAFERRFDQESVVIGRANGCDLQVSDPSLSRRHARLYLQGDSLVIEDLNSSNGTLVNGQRISAPTAVAAGDLVRLSGTELELREVAPPERSARSDTASGAAEMTALRPVSELLEEHDLPAEAAEREETVRYASRLRLLNELHRELGRSIALGEVLELVLDGAFEHLGPEAAQIFLADGAEEELRLAAARPVDESLPALLSETLRGEVMGKGQGALAVDMATDERFSSSKSLMASEARSLMAVPLLDAEGCLGMMVLYSRLKVRTFSEEDLELLASIASAAALRIRNIRLSHEAAERERLENELRLARRIQISLLPKTIPQPPGYRIYAANTPSRAVSGDYYQIVERDGEVALLIADVCGKGMAAALLTASLEAVCCSLLEAGGSAAGVLSQACGFLHQRTPPDKFATACLGLLDVERGTLSFVNAGHNPPLLLRAGGAVEELEASGFPLGMVPACEYEAVPLELAPGDLLFLFTDGIVEAENPEGAQYGLDRLTGLCTRHRRETPQELAAALEADLETHTAGAPLLDDQTFVVLQRGA